MGVSSGACLGAAFVLVSGISLPFILPLTSFAAGLLTVVIVLVFTAAIDRMSSNTTVILIGMVFSLFVRGIMNFLATLYSDHYKRLWLWMMGSFSARNWTHVAMIFPVAVVCTGIIIFFTRELDIMTFGEEQSKAMGVETRKVKTILIILSSILTGVSVSIAGVIGFVDLVAPHIVRKIFGPEHRIVIPLSFIYGGAFMALCDLVARTALSPQEIPIGAVTALIGAPFFAYVFFAGRKK
jgi:iron complex transport system permease protein